MIFGFTARMSSTSMPNFWRCPGRKLVRKTSARLASSSSTSLPSGTDMSRPRLRLPQPALRITGHRVLDLDDFGAPFAQHGTRRRHEPVHRDLEDANAVKGPAHEPGSETTTAIVFDSRNSSSPAVPISRPIPDCLYPPNGLSGLKYMPPLMENVPVLMRRATASARSS